MPGEELLLQQAGNMGSGGMQAGAGVAETIVGIVKNAKAKKEAAKLAARRPKLKSSPFVADELSLAKSELSTGMSAEASAAYEGGLSRDLSTSLDTILKGGGGVNNVAQVFDASAQGRQRLGLIRENLRLNQINNLVRAEDTAEEERKQMFEFNEWRPWADAAQANAAARQQAQNMIWGGIDNIAGGEMKMMGGGNKQGSSGGGGGFMSASVPQASTYNNQPLYQQPAGLTGRTAPATIAAPNFNYPDYTDFSDLG